MGLGKLKDDALNKVKSKKGELEQPLKGSINDEEDLEVDKKNKKSKK